jgi:hypothetical protein
MPPNPRCHAILHSAHDAIDAAAAGLAALRDRLSEQPEARLECQVSGLANGDACPRPTTGRGRRRDRRDAGRGRRGQVSEKGVRLSLVHPLFHTKFD